MNEIATIILAIAVISLMAIVLGIIVSRVQIGQNTNQDLNIPNYDEITYEEEIIMLLRNIARNQKIIKTNTTIIAVITLMPIIISVLILTIKINTIIEIMETLEALFN